jgi:hypothetical protein
VEEAALLDLGSDFSADAGSDGSFVRDEQSASLLHGGLDGVDVVGQDCPQVDDFARDPLLLGHLGGLRRQHPVYHLEHPDRGTIAHQRDILAGLEDLSLAQGNRVVFFGDHILGHAVEYLGLEEDHGVGSCES